MKSPKSPGILLGLVLTVGTLDPSTVPAQEVKSPGAEGQAPPDLTTLSLEALLELDVEAVYGASRFLQRTGEAPSWVSIVTAEQIARYGFRTLDQVLRTLTGFYATYDRNYTYLGVRGFAQPGDYNSRILVLVDGHRLNDAVYDGALAGTDFSLDLELVERIEVIRGPSSSLYGTSAFFAVVNVITRPPKEGREVEAAVRAGSFGSYDGRVAWSSRSRRGLGVVLSGSYYESKGQERLFYPEFAATPSNGYVVDGDRDRYGRFFGALSLQGFTLEGAYSSRTKGIPTASFGTTFGDTGTRTTDARGFAQLKYESKPSSRVRLMGRLAYDAYDYDGSYIYDYSDSDGPPRVVNEDGARSRTWTVETQASTRLGPRNRVTAGFEHRANSRIDQFNFDREPYFQYVDDKRSTHVLALYAQDDFELSRHLRLNAGVRYDHYSTFGGTANPRAGLIFSPSDKTHLKALYGQAFRAPNSYELFYSGALAAPNPNLQPERIRTAELVWEQALPAGFGFTLSGFRNQIRDLITQQTDEDGFITYENASRILAQGVELELEAKRRSGLEARVGYSYQHVRREETEEALSNSPRHLLKVNAAAPLVAGRLFFALSGGYVSERLTLRGGSVAGHFLLHLALQARDLWPGVDASAGVQNASDASYSDPGAEEHVQGDIPQDGLGAWVRLTYRFGGPRR